MSVTGFNRARRMAAKSKASNLEDMTKAELLQYALDIHGEDLPNRLGKAEVLERIRDLEGGD